MKRIALFLAGSLLTIFVANSVAANNAPFSTGPAPVQAYYTMGDHSMRSATQPVNTVPTAVQPAASTPPPPDYRNSAGIDISENAELSRMTEDNLTFEQKANARIENLTQSNHFMAMAIENIDQQIDQLQQQMKKIEPVSNNNNKNHWQQWLNKMNQTDWFFYFNLIITAVFLIRAGLMLRRRLQNKKSP